MHSARCYYKGRDLLILEHRRNSMEVKKLREKHDALMKESHHLDRLRREAVLSAAEFECEADWLDIHNDRINETIQMLRRGVR